MLNKKIILIPSVTSKLLLKSLVAKDRLKGKTQEWLADILGN